MGAIDNFAVLLETTEVMKQILSSVKEEPAHLLGRICREYQRTGEAVPDHRLHFTDYLGEAALKALLSAGLIRQQSGGRLSPYLYEPNTEGLKQYESLKADSFYQK